MVGSNQNKKAAQALLAKLKKNKLFSSNLTKFQNKGNINDNKSTQQQSMA